MVKGVSYFYEIKAPFYRPSHYIDITGVVEEKRRLIRFHEDQKEQENITLSLNAFRGAQMLSHPETIYAEAYLRVDEDSYPEQSLAACLKRV